MSLRDTIKKILKEESKIPVSLRRRLNYLDDEEILSQLKKWEGGPSDEKLIEGGEITILGVEKVGVTGFPNQYHPYVIEKII